jgi:hypothetical protein
MARETCCGPKLQTAPAPSDLLERVEHHSMAHLTAPLDLEPALAALALPDAELLEGELAVARCADPFEQWLRWEERANLVGFRMTVEPVALAVSAIPAERVLVQTASNVPARVLQRFFRAGCVYFPKHPLNRDAKVAFSAAPVAERWPARFTSSRTLVVPPERGEPAFSVKLPTDHPHPDFEQPEKTRLREEAEDAIRIAALIGRVDAALGRDPALQIVSESVTVLVPGSDYGFVVRDLRPLQDGHFYLPALSIPWVGRQIAKLHGEPFERFWGRHYAEAVGRAKAALLARYGLQYETPNPQNVLIQLDASLRPTGAIALRDLGDAVSLMREVAEGENPWGALQAAPKPETPNSFWAFDEADSLSVDEKALEDWFALHDRAYLATLARFFELPPTALAPEGDDRFAGLRTCFAAEGTGERLRAAFERRARQA